MCMVEILLPLPVYIKLYTMKYTEFHRKLQQKGKKSALGWHWTGEAEGSHYIYEDINGRRYPVPFHGAKEIPEPLRRKIMKDMEL